MIDIENSTHRELVIEFNKCQDLWSNYGCGCFGYYVAALHKAITNTGLGFKI